jgi:tetratricopeptide (TPR) repeat protein
VSRVDRLGPATGDLLGVAAVLGRNLEVGLLAGVACIDEDAVVEALDDAAAARLVDEVEVGVYRFSHDLVRSTLYGGLSANRRARLHRRTADALEAQGGDLARIAHHLLAGAPLGGKARTATACRAAGERALAVLADAEAARWFSEGLPFAAEAEDPLLRVDLLIGLGEAQRRIGDTASRQTLLDAAHLARAHGDLPRLVRAVLANNRGVASVVGFVDEERLGFIAAALELLGPAPGPERADLLSVQALELVFAGDHRRVLDAADEAASIAAGLDDVTLRARVGMRRLWAALVPDRVGDLAADGAEVVRLADASGDPHLRSWSRALWGHSLMLAGALDEARRWAAESVAIADETGQPGLRCLAHIFYADAIDAQGDHDEAERLTQGILELGQQSGFADAMMWYLGSMTLDWMFQGQPETTAAVAAQAFAEYPRLVVWQAGWALSLALAGDTEAVAEFLTGVPALVSTVPEDLLWVLAHFFLAAVQGYGVENREAAAAVYERLLPYRGLHAAGGVVLYLGPVEMGLAVLARVLGDIETALAHHEAAAAAIEPRRAARARAFNDQQWAVTLLARDRPGDRSRAAAMLKKNLSYCRTKGYGTFAGWAEKFLAPLG